MAGTFAPLPETSCLPSRKKVTGSRVPWQTAVKIGSGRNEEKGDGLPMERAWSILAVLCLIAAALLLWRAHLDAAFVVAALCA